MDEKTAFTRNLSVSSVFRPHGKNKLEVLNEMIDKAAELSNLDRDMIFRLTWKREQMMTTGIGGGLALPHIRVEHIPHPVIIIGIPETPVTDYQSQDGQPIRVLVFIVAPADNQDAYLQLLGGVSRQMREAGMIDAVAENADNPAKVVELLGGKA